MMTVDYSKLTDRSRATVKKAFDMAKEMNHPEIHPQVMMAAVMEEGRDMVSFLLQQMGADRIAFAGAVRSSVGTPWPFLVSSEFRKKVSSSGVSASSAWAKNLRHWKSSTPTVWRPVSSEWATCLA